MGLLPLGEDFSSREILTCSLSNLCQKLDAVTRDSLSFETENLMCHELLAVGLRGKHSLRAF